MKQEISELAQAVNRLAAAIESLKEAEKENPPCTPLKEKGKKNTHTPRARGGVFITPSLDECRAYAAKMRLAMDAAHFHDHYTSNGWKISGRAPMKDWRAAMRNWARRDKAAVYERKRTGSELAAEAAAARDEQARTSAIAALTERDWALCRESGCRHCAGSGCLRGISLPPDHCRNPRPHRPEECPAFEEGGAA